MHDNVIDYLSHIWIVSIRAWHGFTTVRIEKSIKYSLNKNEMFAAAHIKTQPQNNIAQCALKPAEQ